MDEPFVASYLDGLRGVLDGLDHDAVARVIDVLWQAYRDGRRIFIIGNGGSAATASHMMCDLAKGCAAEGKPRVKAVSLTDNAALMTAIGNDIGYERLFTEQLRVLLEPGDVVVAITASGNSPNILDAVRYAREHGATAVGLIGFGGGRLKGMVDADVTVDSRNYGHVEDVHGVLEHLISQCLRERIARA
jgi:D-sedoheptulose 7-phosphate isomerase